MCFGTLRTLLIEVKRHTCTHTTQTSITSVFHIRVPKLSEVKILMNAVELRRYRARIQTQASERCMQPGFVILLKIPVP